MATKFGFMDMHYRFQQMKRTLPLQIGNMGTRHFRRSFEDQGFTDERFEKWQKPQRLIPGTSAYKYPKKNAATRHARGILVQRGFLRNAVQNSLRTFTWENISWEVSLPYAEVHNEGLEMKNGKKMPQRKFIGESKVLLKAIQDKIINELNKLRK